MHSSAKRKVTTSLVFIGAANSFREVLPIIQDINSEKRRYEVIAIVDDDAAHHGTEIEGVPVVGSLEKVRQFDRAKFVFGIGSFRTRLLRKRILCRMNLPHERFEAIVHPSVRIYKSATISPGAIVYPGVTVCNNAEIGPFCIVTFDAVIGPFVRLEPCAMVTTRSVVLSAATIGPSAFIGVNSVIGEGISVGAAAVVVMGSVVFQNIRPGAIVQGNPARLVMQGKVPAELSNAGGCAPGSK